MDEPEKLLAAPEPQPQAQPKRRGNYKLDEQMQAEICAVVGVGASMRAAARLVGCSAAAITQLAKKDEGFRRRLYAAAMKREVAPLQHIRNAGQSNWRAAAWLLQRLNPGEYVPGKPHVVTREQMTAVMEKFAAIVIEVVPKAKRAKLDGRIAEIVRQACENQEVDEQWRRLGRHR